MWTESLTLDWFRSLEAGATVHYNLLEEGNVFKKKTIRVVHLNLFKDFHEIRKFFPRAIRKYQKGIDLGDARIPYGILISSFYNILVIMVLLLLFSL